MGGIKSYKELIVWQKAMDIVTDIYQLTKLLPKEEIYSLTSQMRRCAISIPSNIAEGFARKSNQDFSRFLQIALGSLYELQTQVEICLKLEYFKIDGTEDILKKSNETEKMLNTLIKKLIQKSV